MGQTAQAPTFPGLSELLGGLRGKTRAEIAKVIACLSEDEALALLYDWRTWARPKQLEPPGGWSTLLWLAGRGFGKTRALSETVRGWAESGVYGRIALVAATTSDLRETLVEGESGILSICPPWNFPTYEPSKRRVTWPNGARCTLFSAEEPERLRGPNHDAAACDELCAWPEGGREAWDQLQFTLRLGKNPKTVIATTPKPTELLLEFVEDPLTRVIKGSTLENSRNLSPKFLKKIFQIYGGTRLGRQELNAEILSDTPGAIFQRVWFNLTRVPVWFNSAVCDANGDFSIDLGLLYSKIARIVIAVDPAPTSNEGSDFTGIFAFGVGHDEHGYLLEDATIKGTPDEWGRAALACLKRWGAETIVAEVNTGGEMVKHVFKTIDPDAPFKEVRARKGKEKRAEPVAALWEQKKIHIVGDGDPWRKFEGQAARFTGVNGRRDDRVDAMIWGAHETMLGDGAFLL